MHKSVIDSFFRTHRGDCHIFLNDLPHYLTAVNHKNPLFIYRDRIRRIFQIIDIEQLIFYSLLFPGNYVLTRDIQDFSVLVLPQYLHQDKIKFLHFYLRLLGVKLTPYLVRYQKKRYCVQFSRLSPTFTQNNISQNNISRSSPPQNNISCNTFTSIPVGRAHLVEMRLDENIPVNYIDYHLSETEIKMIRVAYGYYQHIMTIDDYRQMYQEYKIVERTNNERRIIVSYLNIDVIYEGNKFLVKNNGCSYNINNVMPTIDSNQFIYGTLVSDTVAIPHTNCRYFNLLADFETQSHSYYRCNVSVTIPLY